MKANHQKKSTELCSVVGDDDEQGRSQAEIEIVLIVCLSRVVMTIHYHYQQSLPLCSSTKFIHPRCALSGFFYLNSLLYYTLKGCYFFVCLSLGGSLVQIFYCLR